MQGGPDAGAASCSAEPCDLFSQCGCPDGLACTLHSVADGTTSCRAVAGDGTSGQTCSNDVECAAGYGCYGSLCRKYCERDQECGTGSFCVLDIGSEITKVCSTPCKPEAQSGSGCPSNLTCDLFDADPDGVPDSGDELFYTECRQKGTGGEGDDCTSPSNCQAGHTCAQFSPTFQICTQTCLVPEGDPFDTPGLCANDGICRGYQDEVVIAGTEYGSCAP